MYVSLVMVTLILRLRFFVFGSGINLLTSLPCYKLESFHAELVIE